MVTDSVSLEGVMARVCTRTISTVGMRFAQPTKARYQRRFRALTNHIVMNSISGQDVSSVDESTRDSSNSCLVGYKVPPKEILRIVDQPREPLYSFSPLRDMVLEIKRPAAHPSVIDYSRPELKLAGVRLDPSGFCRSKLSYNTGLALAERGDDLKLPLDEEKRRVILGIPDGYGIRDVSWSPDGKHVAFTLRRTQTGLDDARPPAELWITDIKSCKARVLVKDLNSTFAQYAWIDESNIVVPIIPPTLGPSPTEGRPSFGPRIEDNTEGKKSQTRTYQDLLKNSHDEKLFSYYSESKLIRVDIETGNVQDFGDSSRVYTSISSSPSGAYVLVSWLQKPWSYAVPCGRFPKVVQIWDGQGNFIKEIANLPLALHIPLAFDSCRAGPRGISWRDDKPHEVTWAECQDGGDPAVEVSPRDVVYSLDVSQQEKEPLVVGSTDMRYSGTVWCDDSFALLYESEWKTRRSRTWIIHPDGLGDPELLFDLNYEDSYNDPGSPVLRRNKEGSYVIAEIDKKKQILLSGAGASPEGSKPFLDLLDLETKSKRRIWRSSPPYYEVMSTILNDNVEGVIPLGDLQMLARRETEDYPPQFSIATFASDGTLKDDRQISNFPHPYPGLVGMKKEILQYEREDGVKLNATFYLPPNYDPERDGKLPCILWAYPREFKSKDAAGQLRKSPHQFVNIGSTSPLMLLTEGYAILDGPSFPIFGEDNEEPNDTYVEQLTSSARAAVAELDRLGCVDTSRICVGGHSYGAFMAAGLLAHAPGLFKCGIARSGAYNRTMTPFGFQAEERTLWEAKETYAKMSPFMNADRIQEPLLLIHGEADNNPGTFPLQSERMYAALKGHGVTTKLVILPYESHGYSARESILHCLAEMADWLQKYC